MSHTLDTNMNLFIWVCFFSSLVVVGVGEGIWVNSRQLWWSCGVAQGM